MDAFDALKGRMSIRVFSDEAVSQTSIEQILDAARLAPTARNEQPWQFFVVTNYARKQRIAELAEYGKFIAQAPVCLAVVCEDTKYYLEDGAAATTYILVAAHAFGIAGCWVAGDKKAYADDVLRAISIEPGKYKLVSLIALGKPGRAQKRPAKKTLKQVIQFVR